MYPLKTKTKYDPSNLAATGNLYTTVYLGNYEPGNFDEGAGSHPGVDIIPAAPHDAVVAVLDGTVHFAGTNAANGNYVVVKHPNAPDPSDPSKTTTLYSVFLHLSEFSVTAGQAVKEGDALGKTGNTGQSTGEHLHFQIDTGDAPFHPYWPFTFGEANEAGLGFFEAVNRGFGIEKARQYTVNPLVYLDAVESSGKKPTVSAAALTESAAVPVKTVVAPIETVVVAARTETPSEPTVAKIDPATSPTLDSTGFSDVPASHPYAEAVKFVREQGIATGSGGKFRPNDTVTRGEILKMAFNGAVRALSSDSNQYFSDVPPSNEFFAYVNTARDMKAVSGYSDGTFRPNAPVTRAEALKIVLGIFGIIPEPAPLKVFSDVGSEWYAPYAAWAKLAGIFDDGNGKFAPSSPASRAEVAAVIHACKSA